MVDCLNGGKRYDLNGYESENGAPLASLSGSFLEWLNYWEMKTETLNLRKSEKNCHIFSYQTSAGLKITTNSFTSLTRDGVLFEPEAEFLLPEKLNQVRRDVFFAKLVRWREDFGKIPYS